MCIATSLLTLVTASLLPACLPPAHLSILAYLPKYVPACVFACMYVCLSVVLPACIPTWLFACLSMYLPACISAPCLLLCNCLPVLHLPVCLPMYYFIYYFFNVSHHFPLKTSLKNIHMTMVHSKKNYERLISLKPMYVSASCLSAYLPPLCGISLSALTYLDERRNESTKEGFNQ